MEDANKGFIVLKSFFNKETISYIFFGVLTTIVSIATYFIFNFIFEDFALRTSISTIMSWVFAVAFAFITNKLFVFNSKSMELKVVLKEVTSFVSARLISLGFELVWMIVTVDVCFKFFADFYLLQRLAGLFGFEYFDFYQFLAKCIANVFVLIMNYIFSKLFIFKDEKNINKGVNNGEE